MAIGNLAPMIHPNRAAPAADPGQERLLAAQAGLVENEAEPLNCETPASALGGEVTPTTRFYRRNHFPIPVLDKTTWRLGVSGMVERPLSLGLRDLMRLPPETAGVTLAYPATPRLQFPPPP